MYCVSTGPEPVKKKFLLPGYLSLIPVLTLKYFIKNTKNRIS